MEKVFLIIINEIIICLCLTTIYSYIFASSIYKTILRDMVPIGENVTFDRILKAVVGTPLSQVKVFLVMLIPGVNLLLVIFLFSRIKSSTIQISKEIVRMEKFTEVLVKTLDENFPQNDNDDEE